MRHHEGRSKGRGSLPWLIVAAGEAVSAGFLLVPDARVRLVPYLLLFAAGSVNALAAGRSLSGSRLRFLLVCGALFRATLWLRSPDLSDDVYRFAWDGRVAAAGVSPYAFAPDDPALSGIAPELKPRVGHRDARTVYPPVAQAAFRAGALAAPREVVALKALFALADLAVVALVHRLGGPTAGFAAALYAFHPLPITESAGQGHCDALGVALLLASLAYLAAGRRARAGVAFALSVLTKYVSGAAALPLLRRGRLAAAGAFFITVLGLWLVAGRGGASPAGGLGNYATRWDFNSVIYRGTVAGVEALDLPERARQLFVVLEEKLGHPAWAQKVFPFFYPAFFARVLLGLILFAVLLLIDRRRRTGGAEPAVLPSLAALTLLSPTLHPWYVLWVLPLAARAKDPAFLYLAGAVPLSYALLYPTPGLPAPLVLTVEFAPFALLLAITLRRGLPLPPGEGRGVPAEASAKAGEGRA
ncbi:MAG: hypothetical protein ACRD00_02825 [Thermoanaerobaculia bacterium]